ncbi:MAG: hypothetical protein AMS27_12820 [Bacteroides sp. SM23_62_1]|nr:MAG: hypothetical protein AMS27_12820 [Bacteroides sp. SM23_62_1]
MNPEDLLINAKAYLWKESFAIIKSDKIPNSAFCVIKDKDETTVIIDQNRLKDIPIKESEKNWKIITLDIIFPMDTIGILSKISGCLAEKGIPIMAISAYSRDHFLIRKNDTRRAVRALELIGITVS